MKKCLAVIFLLVVSSQSFAQECGVDLKPQLLKRAEKDQAVRTALIASPSSDEMMDQALRVDADNTAFMRKVLAKCDWPKKSVVGDEAALAAWLLTQHADMDPEYQVLAARKLKYAVMVGEADGERLASLVDRNRWLSNQPQVYARQTFTSTAGEIEFYDIVNPAELDRRLEQIHMPPFYCWALHLSKDGKGAPIHWPAGVPFRPATCDDSP